jgi:hypothetical protein
VTLKDVLLTPDVRPRLLKDAEQLVESEVSAKSGISGMAIKAGYKAVKAIKPGLIPEALNNLVDRFVERLEPFFTAWTEAGKPGSFGSYLTDRSGEVANALLGVTDERARRSSGTVKSTYDRLRPQGEKNVKAAVPGLGRIVDKYVQ